MCHILGAVGEQMPRTTDTARSIHCRDEFERIRGRYFGGTHNPRRIHFLPPCRNHSPINTERRRDLRQWNEHKGALRQIGMRQSQLLLCRRDAVHMEQIEIYRTCAPMLMPHASEFPFDALHRREELLGRTVKRDARGGIQKRRLIRLSPRRRLIKCRDALHTNAIQFRHLPQCRAHRLTAFAKICPKPDIRCPYHHYPLSRVIETPTSANMPAIGAAGLCTVSVTERIRGNVARICAAASSARASINAFGAPSIT